MNVHFSVRYMRVQQFIADVEYSCNAIQLGLCARGSDFVIVEKGTKERIVVHHIMLQTHKYGDDLESFKAKQFKMIFE